MRENLRMGVMYIASEEIPVCEPVFYSCNLARTNQCVLELNAHCFFLTSTVLIVWHLEDSYFRHLQYYVAQI